ncbi:hypothetical protein [Nioella nitratireducens]|uniref:hypothetical protein n=1 Tax=Nioella nitratireducens TaxID=1287720 RepID=UPI0008FD7FF0|nr:hypothetical protein [Nioella nitratireducens]
MGVSVLALILSTPIAHADLGGALGGVGDSLGGGLGEVVGGVGDVVSGVGDTLNGADNGGTGGLGDTVGGAVGGDLGGALDGTVDTVGDVLNGGSSTSPENPDNPSTPGTPGMPGTQNPDGQRDVAGRGAGGGGGPRCAAGGNSTAYNGYQVVDRRGNPLGWVEDATVDSRLNVDRVRFMANGNVTGAPACIEFGGGNISVSNGNVQLPISQSDVARAYAGQ